MLVEIEKGKTQRCTALRKLEYLTCGDYVQWQRDKAGSYRVTQQLPRRNVLTRPNFRGKLRAVAANIDQLVIVIAWRPKPIWDMLDRYLIMAEQLGVQATIILNKNDLFLNGEISDKQIKQAKENLSEYQRIGYSLLTLSLFEKEGLEALKQQLLAKTSILAGQSGVGKSSLAQLILPSVKFRIAEISVRGEGRHTTTRSTLYEIAKDSYLIDSPGVRDFPLPSLSERQLAQGYREFQAYSENCRFNNCLHDKEPDCAVKKAVIDKEIFTGRYKRYLFQKNNLSPL